MGVAMSDVSVSSKLGFGLDAGGLLCSFFMCF
jgi:hypothetical protein